MATIAKSPAGIAPLALIGASEVPLEARSGRVTIRSINPAHPERTVWAGAPTLEQVDAAVGEARQALPAWSRAPIGKRVEVLRAFKAIVESREAEIADLICEETGKALWEAQAEAKLLAAKVDNTLLEGPMSAGSGRARVTGYEIPLGPGRAGRCTFRPHGVMAVLGPFNFPAHLPNGHIVPALLMGNTVVFKPSDKTPAVGQLLGMLIREALVSCGVPPGIVNVIHGAADVASRLVAHEGIDGILFTGSWPVGRRILEANLDLPGRIIALEMGGNNAAVVMQDADLRLAAIECARAAFATTGQRCTCTRRLIVHESIAPEFGALFAKVGSNLLIGDPRGIQVNRDETTSGRSSSLKSQASSRPLPFMGPIIRAEARDAVLAFQQRAISAGAGVVMECEAIEHPSGGFYISPGILRVDRFSMESDSARDAGCDVEVFGPLLRISECRDLDDAIAQANATRFGLAASIFTRDRAAAERFITECRAGCINVNTGTAGASGKLPFGGIGYSGNHRPAGAFSLDYCAYPVASMIETGSGEMTLSVGMRFEERWLG